MHQINKTIKKDEENEDERNSNGNFNRYQTGCGL